MSETDAVVEHFVWGYHVSKNVNQYLCTETRQLGAS